MNGDIVHNRKEVFLLQKKITKEMCESFCCHYVTTGNAEEAAVRAGFDRNNALEEGIRCLKSKGCRSTINSLRELLSDSGTVAAGLRRLAFGNCSDAVYLVFADELPPADVIAKLDLFNVSELKRVKGGGVEVKLFDRMKALEKLFELENSFSEKNKADGLIKALASHNDEEDECLDNQ